ncbi:7200_t:CDS:2 [Diversispora eburnea]|uniref:7200_t:CDS:1 n=1 Tax=Diversispora eburnea TaxID=1213867 RepID=A0A9N9BUQ7_9GLOM|nr:7200_t:CDS:2 [Diversispora eburnea]
MPIVRIGPNYSFLQKYNVNDDKNPIFINSTHFTGYITFRLKNHHYKDENVTKTCTYFENHSRLFSIQFQGRFKPTNSNRSNHLWSFDDIFFCAETEESTNPPIGSQLAVKFAQFIDPGFMADKIFNSKRPWCGMGPWVNYGKNYIKEDTSLIHHEHEEISLDSSKRRYYFLDPSIRNSHFFDPSLVYAFDFFNNFIDFSMMNANMIIKFSIKKVLVNQPLRFVCRNYDGDAIFFVIEIDYSDIC